MPEWLKHILNIDRASKSKGKKRVSSTPVTKKYTLAAYVVSIIMIPTVCNCYIAISGDNYGESGGLVSIVAAILILIVISASIVIMILYQIRRMCEANGYQRTQILLLIVFILKRFLISLIIICQSFFDEFY